ncbi:MAG: hypothetical protein ACRDNW_09050 [Trebonia sp.]
MIGSFPDRVKEIHRSLDGHAIAHAFGGAIALIYGVADPRLTHDIDLNISVSVREAERVFRALPSTLAWSPEDVEAVRREGQVRLRWQPDLPVDIFFPQHRFHGVVAARVRTVTFDGEMIPVVTPTDLTVFKAMFNRSKDWPDIEAMLRAGTVDEGEALRWLGEILGEDHRSRARLAGLIEEVHASPGEDRAGDPNVWRAARLRDAPDSVITSG